MIRNRIHSSTQVAHAAVTRAHIDATRRALPQTHRTTIALPLSAFPSPPPSRSWSCSELLLARKPPPHATTNNTGAPPRRTPPSSIPQRADGGAVPVRSQAHAQSQSRLTADRSWLLRPLAPAVNLSLQHKLVFVATESAMVVSSFLMGGFLAGVVPLALGHAGVDLMSRVVMSQAMHLPITIAAYFILQQTAARYMPRFMSMPPPAPSAATPAGSDRRRFFIRAACSLAVGLVVFWWEERSLAYDDARKVYPSVNPVLSEMALDGRLHVVLQTPLLAPATEELLFRGFIFARCLRMLGAIPAYALGAVLFGVLHYDPRTSFSFERIMSTARSAVFYCLLYQWTGTLLAPTAFHAADNSHLVFNDALCSPMRPLETLNDVFHKRQAREAALVAGGENLSEQVAAMIGTRPKPSSEWLSGDGQSLRPEAQRVTRAIFSALDRGGKGHLSADEVAWACMLQPQRHEFLSAALSVIERRVGGSDAAKEHIRQNMRLSTTIQPIALPSAHFFTQQQQQSAARRIHSALADSESGAADTPNGAALLLQHAAAPNWASMRAEPSLSPLVVPSADPRTGAGVVDPLQRRLFDQYYTLYWRAFYDARFSQPDAAAAAAAVSSQTGAAPTPAVQVPPSVALCTLDRFESMVSRRLALSPRATESWLRAVSEVLQGQHEHPTQALVDAHDQGRRQGFRGHRVQAN